MTTVAPGEVTGLLRQLARAPARPAPAAGPDLRIGEVVGGRFELVREIGRGGFGVVFEARDRKLRRPVAFKALRVVGDVDLLEERLLREAEAAAQLAHPSIVTLHDVGQSEQGPYLVLELLQGRTLGDRLRGGPVPPREALRIAAAVAQGLAHAHARGVIHRDLTPGNLFLCDDGGVKVLDFGLAHGLGRRKLEGGTRLYMAPEQRRGAPEDERTDVFALGAILYQMLAGEPPFPAAELQRRPTRARRLEVAGAPGAGALLARMLSDDPVERPRDGREVAEALAALGQQLDGAPGADAPVRLRPRPPRLRRSVLVAAAAIGAGALAWWWPPMPPPAGLGGAASPPPGPARGETRTARREEPPPPSPTPPPRVEEPRERPAPAVKRPPRGRVLFCRDAIQAIPTPPPGSGEGVLVVEADPFGEYSVNGQPRGETPGECRVTAGTYLVRAVHPEFGPREEPVEVKAGQRTRWLARFLEER